MLMAVLWRLGDSCGSVLKRAREHNVDFLYFFLFLCFLGGFLFWVSEKNEKAIRASLGLRSGPMVRLMGVVYHGRLKIRVGHRPLDLVLSEKELALVRGAEVLKRISLSWVKNFELSHAQKTATTGAIEFQWVCRRWYSHLFRQVDHFVLGSHDRRRLALFADNGAWVGLSARVDKFL